MLRETGLHAALAMALAVLLGAILDNVPVGFAVGLLAAALVTARWPTPTAVPSPVDVDAPASDGITPHTPHSSS